MTQSMRSSRSSSFQASCASPTVIFCSGDLTPAPAPPDPGLAGGEDGAVNFGAAVRPMDYIYIANR